MKSLPFIGATLLLAAAAFPALAQEQATTANSNGTLRPIPQSDQMFRKTIWRSLDLREKQNRPMFSDGKEITRVIIDAVKRKELDAYKHDSLTTLMTRAELRRKTSFEDAPVEAVPGGDDWDKGAKGEKPAVAASSNNDGWGDLTPPAPAGPPVTTTQRRPRLDARGRPMRDRNGRPVYQNVTVTRAASVSMAAPSAKLTAYRAKDLYQLDIKEFLIFDKKRSRMYNEIQSVTLFVPATAPGNTGNRDIEVGTFKYSDLVKVFRNNPQTAIWFNAQNDAQHKNLADAFELGLYSSYITKVSNVANSRLDEVYTGRQGILAASQAASELVEYEYSLWNF